MPVNPLISPARAFLYRPLGSRSSQTSSGVSTKTSQKSMPSSLWISRQKSRSFVGADEARERDDARVGEELAHLADAPDVLLAVLGAEAQVLVEAHADVVAVEAVGGDAGVDERLLEGDGDGALARAERPVNQSVMPLLPRAPQRSSRVMLPSCQWTLVALTSVIRKASRSWNVLRIVRVSRAARPSAARRPPPPGPQVYARRTWKTRRTRRERGKPPRKTAPRRVRRPVPSRPVGLPGRAAPRGGRGWASAALRTPPGASSRTTSRRSREVTRSRCSATGSSGRW
jgi:hypothetical protein